MIKSIIKQLDILEFTRDSKAQNIDLFDKVKYGDVRVYTNNDQPVLFLKEIESFDSDGLKLIAEIQHLCWNYQKVLFLYVFTKTEIRVYNCSEKPFSFNTGVRNTELNRNLKKLELFSCFDDDLKKLEELNLMFSRIAIDTGFIWSSIEAFELRKKIKIERRVDKYLISSLIKVSESLNRSGLNDTNIIHKLVMRSLFLLYLEDRGATLPELYQLFLVDAKSYFDILSDVDATYNLFNKLADDFNGGLFLVGDDEKELITKHHLELLKKCFTNGFIDEFQKDLFPDWRLFDFSIIRIELLSEIYETFLSKLDNKEKKDTGTFYTPPTLVELILNENLSIKTTSKYDIKILDPSCGSGIFLVDSFKRLIKIYERNHNTPLTDFRVLSNLLRNNIFGIELDPKSIKVAAFSLYLALLDNLNPKTGWWHKRIEFPILINDPNDTSQIEPGYNLFVRDTISDLSDVDELENFDLIVGNPPFGTSNLLPSIRSYCQANGFAKEMVLPFLHKSTTLAPNGKIALIFNTKILTNTGGTYQNFRRWLFNECYVEKIFNFSILRKAKKNYGGQLFGSAVGPISIVFFQKEAPKKKAHNIQYYSPKTYIKNNFIEGVVIDSSDVKSIPRIECQKQDSKIWKIAMWGNYADFGLIEELSSKSNLETLCENNGVRSGVGFQLLTRKQDSPRPSEYLANSKYLDAEKIDRYYTPESKFDNINVALKTDKARKFYFNHFENNDITTLPKIDIFRRLGDMNAYSSPHIIVKKGLIDNLICASYLDKDCTFRDGVYGFYSSNETFLKALVALFNSKISSYFLFLTISSYGIEREQIMKREFLTLPYSFDIKIEQKLALLIDKISDIIKSDKLVKDISVYEKKIDDIIYYDILKLSNREVIIIEDTIHYSLDLFENQEKSEAMMPVVSIEKYAHRLIEELEVWLNDVELKVTSTIYDISIYSPLCVVKVSFGDNAHGIDYSKENLNHVLKDLDKKLWDESGEGLYFRKCLNYYDGDEVYIVKPNQRRFWSESMSMEDSRSLIIEIGNGND